MRDITYYDEKTLLKARKALEDVMIDTNEGVVNFNEEDKDAIITALLNAGILLRERVR